MVHVPQLLPPRPYSHVSFSAYSPVRPVQWEALPAAAAQSAQWPESQTRFHRISHSNALRATRVPIREDMNIKNLSSAKRQAWVGHKGRWREATQKKTEGKVTLPTAEKKCSMSWGWMPAATCIQKTVQPSRSSGLRLSTGFLSSEWTVLRLWPQCMVISPGSSTTTHSGFWLKQLIHTSQSLKSAHYQLTWPGSSLWN